MARELPKPKRKPRLTGEALEKEQRLRDEIESRRAVQQMQRLQLQKDQQELRQLDKLQKSMRSRDYGYDHNGELVVVQKLDPDRMPGFAGRDENKGGGAEGNLERGECKEGSKPQREATE